ncbi:hypothetical protein EPO14_02980 [Patescibacteria group bacterium]|nr:MAG: hypothetical protein EPO14_02980 [Patescibacteria group bacterium]
MRYTSASMQKLALSPRKQTALLGTILGLASLALHAIPFFLFGRHPLGYDTGFYRRYLIEPITSFPNASVPGLGDDAFIVRMFLDILRFLHLPTDLILYGSYLAFWALMPVLLFFFLKLYLQKHGAFIAGLLLVGSSVAYNGYWYFLLKNALALNLILLAFIAIERRWSSAWFVLDIAIVLTHKTSAIIYILTLIALFIFSRGRRNEYALHIIIAGALFALINAPTVHELSVALPSAVFLDWQTYLWLSLPFILAIAVAGKTFLKYKIPSTLLALAGVSLLFPLFRLPFYERVFIFLDITLAGLAGYGIHSILSSVKSAWGTKQVFMPFMFLALFVGLFLGNLWNQVTSTLPLISNEQILRIEEIAKVIPAEATILTTSDEAPWFEGWTNAHIAAPGMLNDNHNLEAWTELWSGASTEQKIKFLDDFQKPLYISTFYAIEDIIGKAPECVHKVAENLWLVACEKSK